MVIINQTPFICGWTVSFQSDGREIIVVVIKATYVLNAPSLNDIQLPLLEADIFGTDPAKNAPILENDFAHFKPY